MVIKIVIENLINFKYFEHSILLLNRISNSLPINNMSLKLLLATLLITTVLNQCTSCGSSNANCANCNNLDIGNSLYSNSYAVGNSLSSFGLGGLNTGMNTGLSGISGLNGLSGGYSNAGLNALNGLTGLNSDFGGLSTNIGSLGLVGTGVGLNTTGLGLNSLGSSDASYVLNTPSLTGNTFTSSIVNSVLPSSGNTLSPNPIATSLTTVIPTSTYTTTAITAFPTSLGLKVKDTNGAILQINAYDASRTSGSLNIKNYLDKWSLFNSKNQNREDIVRDTLVSGETLNEGEYLRSSNRAYYLALQSDGNLVVYCSKVLIAKNSLWASNTDNRG